MPQRITPETYRTQELIKYLGARYQDGGKLLAVGASDGKLLAGLVSANIFDDVLAIDPSPSHLEKARRKVDWSIKYSGALSARQTRYELMVSAMGYRDERLEGFDVALLSNVVEKIPPERLRRILAPVFEQWRPEEILLVVPNQVFALESNEKDNRRADDQGEWTPDSLGTMCLALGEETGYRSSVSDLGAADSGPTPFLVALFCSERGA